ncbi:MAG: hypothetical protein IT340_22725 [Chloroflexi bacterium]|nr:hypothetical protein [Chloroflexota bacterium]
MTDTAGITTHAAPVPASRPGWWARGWAWLHADGYRLALLALLALSLPLVTHRVYASDEVQYFSYLRSVWFDRDLDFTNEYTHFIDRYPAALAGFKQTNLDRLSDRGTPTGPSTGLPQNFGPIGSALLWTPFFAAGHLAALGLRALGLPVAVDGYSPPYIWAITTGSAILTAIALLLLYRLATGFVSRAAAFWATLAIWLGTPVIFYSHGAPAYSHAASLFAITVFLVAWHGSRPLTSRRAWQWALLGALAALVTMVREQDGVLPLAIVGAEGLLALPALWRDARDRAWAPLARLVGGGALMLATWLIAFTPQLATYWVLNGAFRPNQNVTDKMLSWVPRHALTVVLSPEYGLIFWTPLVALALPGLLWLWRRDRTLTLALALCFAATWYITAVYNTGPSRGSFGARRFLNCTPVFLLGLAAAFQALRERRLAPLVPVLSLLGIWWNLGLVIQFALQLMDRQRLELGVILYNQVVAVPARLLEIARTLLLDRDRLFKN